MDYIDEESGNDRSGSRWGITRSQIGFSLSGTDLLITIDDSNSATATDRIKSLWTTAEEPSERLSWPMVQKSAPEMIYEITRALASGTC
jgi:hypothetical protein